MEEHHSNQMDDYETLVPWDFATRVIADAELDYVGNLYYSANAQFVMDICYDCYFNRQRLPTLSELRSVTKLQDIEIRRACDNLRLMGWEKYAAIGDAIPASPMPRPPRVPRVPSARARVKQKIPSDLRWMVWERDNFTCLNCGSRADLSIDHIHPESLGGLTVAGNLQTLCKPCNSRKGARP